MDPLILLTLSLVLPVLAAARLLRHRRNLRHHRAALPVIGSNRTLTEALHLRLCERPIVPDWRSAQEMRAKVLHGGFRL